MSGSATSAVVPHALPTGSGSSSVFSSPLTHASAAFLGATNNTAQNAIATNPSPAAAALLEAAAVVSSATPMNTSHVAVAAAPSPLAVAHMSGTASAFPMEYLCWSSAAPSLTTVTTATVPIMGASASTLPLVAPHTAHALLGAQNIVPRSDFTHERDRASAAASLQTLHRAAQESTRRREEEYKRSRELLRQEGGIDPRNILPRATEAQEPARRSSPLEASLSPDDSDDGHFPTSSSVHRRSHDVPSDENRAQLDSVGFPSVALPSCRSRLASGRGMSSSPEVWQAEGLETHGEGKDEAYGVSAGLTGCTARETSASRPARLAGRGAAHSLPSAVAPPRSFPGARSRCRAAVAQGDSMAALDCPRSHDVGEQEPTPWQSQYAAGATPAPKTTSAAMRRKRKLDESLAEEHPHEVGKTTKAVASSSSFSSCTAPLKSEDCEEEPTCRICLETSAPHEVSKIDGCAHLFCFDCIEKWAARENTCPLCKTRFNRIERLHRAPPTKPGGKRTRGDSTDHEDTPKVKFSKRVKNRDQRADLVQPSGATVQDVIENMEATGIMRTLLASLGNSIGESTFGGILTITSAGGPSAGGARSRVVRINATPATAGVSTSAAAASAVARARSLASIIQVRRSGGLPSNMRQTASVVIDDESVPATLSSFRDSQQRGAQRYTWAAADFLAPSSGPSPPRSYASNATDSSAGVTADCPLEIDDSDDDGDDEVEVLSEVEVLRNPTAGTSE